MTLDRLPSWCNLHGGIDRSACIEVRLSEVRELAGCIAFHYSKRGTKWRTVNDTLPLPDEQPALRVFRAPRPNGVTDAGSRTGSRRSVSSPEIIATRLASGIYTIDAHTLHELHRKRMPRTLAGDLRTNRANVMRDENFDLKPRRKQKPGGRDKFLFRNRVSTSQPFAFPFDLGLEGNPNKGAARSKRIGLPGAPHWSQSIRIEKWVFPRRIQPAYYLICPGFNHREHREHRERFQDSKGKSMVLNHKSNHAVHHSHFDSDDSHQSPNPSSVLSVFSVVQPSVAPLSTRKPGREHPSTKKCPQRTLKLLMVQCTHGEHRDAKLAQLWINSLPPALRSAPKYRDHVIRLTQRYGLLFEPRTLLCPRCLNVRYGNNPETIRQGWRRRNNKADTSITAVENLPKLKKKRLNHWEKIEMDFVRMRQKGCKRGSKKRKRKRA